MTSITLNQVGDFMTVNRAAEVLKLPYTTVIGLINRHHLNTYVIGNTRLLHRKEVDMLKVLRDTGKVRWRGTHN